LPGATERLSEKAPQATFSNESEEGSDMTNLAAELEQEFELENERETQGESEQEAFFNHLSAMADRGGRSQALRRIALQAAREALRGAMRSVPAIEGESELESAASEFELELEFDPGRRANLEAMLEHFAHAASEAQSEQEAAEQFLPLIPLAAKFALPLLARAMPLAAKGIAKLAPRAIGKVVPNLTRGIGNISRALYRNRTTRPLMRALPRIARTTVASIANQYANGRSITPRSAAMTLARQTARVLSNPRTLSATCRRSIAKDRLYHHRSRRLLGPISPVGPQARRAVCPTCGR
jgi:hypothetical protein